MRWRLGLVCLLLTASLAGCLGAGDSDATDPTQSAAGDAANDSARLERPNWSIGDAWTWSNDQVGEVTYAVTGETEDDWIVDTTNEDVAFFDARFDVSTLGEVRKSDYAGSQSDTRVEFFDWPLEPGKTWTTTWDGVEREITVDRVEDSIAHLTARQNGRVAVEYTFDASAGSFGELVFVDANGTETFGMTLQSSTSDYDQPTIRWNLTTALDREGSFEAQSFGFGFEIPENATDLWLDLSIVCPSGSYSFGFGPSDLDGEGTRYSNDGQCPDEVNETGVIGEDPEPGSYRGGFSGVSPAAEGSYDFLLYVRTLQQIPVGEG